MTQLIASGTVTVRSLDSGREWDEKVEVFARDMKNHDHTVEDAARNIARRQGQIETLEASLE